MVLPQTLPFDYFAGLMAKSMELMLDFLSLDIVSLKEIF
jgi:hypothetical protein